MAIVWTLLFGRGHEGSPHAASGSAPWERAARVCWLRGMTKHHPTALIAGVLGALALAPAAFAGQVPRDDLNPTPPDFYTCKASGERTICRASLVEVEEPVDTGLECPGFNIVDQGTETSEFVRRYDADGNWVKRVEHERWTDSFWSNPLNGNTLPYTQRNIYTDVLGVPGDDSTITETQVGENIYTDPVTHKKVLTSVGRTVFSPDGLEAYSGQQPFIALDIFGDTSAFDAVCAALAR